MSTLHRFHPDPKMGDPEDALLFDGCARCAEHAQTWTTSLDGQTLGFILARPPVTEVERQIRAAADRVIATSRGVAS